MRADRHISKLLPSTEEAWAESFYDIYLDFSRDRHRGMTARSVGFSPTVPSLGLLKPRCKRLWSLLVVTPFLGSFFWISFESQRRSVSLAGRHSTACGIRHDGQNTTEADWQARAEGLGTRTWNYVSLPLCRPNPTTTRKLPEGLHAEAS